MSAGYGPGQLYRVQASDGRGPWRPGLSRFWIDNESDKPLHKDVIAAFGLDWRKRIPKGWSAGCACRSLEQLFGWFTPIEMTRLRFMGYEPVCFMPDKIIAEDDNQVIFARKLPLTEQVSQLSWPAGLSHNLEESMP